MNVKYKWMIIVGILFIEMPLFVNGSWQSDFCVDYGDLENPKCENASNGWTAPYCVYGDVDNARNCAFPSLVNVFTSGLNSDSFGVKNMITQYCTSLLGNHNQGRIYYSVPSTVVDSRDWSQTFDSHQSLFTYLLCSSTVNNSGPLSFSGVFLGDVAKILKLQQMSDGKDQCSPSETLENCDMSLYATEIFSALMSEMFKIKYVQIFHIDSVESFQSDRDKRILEFLSGYFNMSDGKYIKEFQNTVDIIDSNQNSYKKVLDSLKLFDNSSLAKMAKESGCPITGNMVGADFIACALHESQGNGISLNPAFETLFYNEVMSYRIFVSYYLNWVNSKLKKTTLESKDREILQSKAVDLQAYSELQLEAAKQTLHNFEEFSMTYPLHIGLLLYQEKIKRFRDKNLPPIVKTFYSLSEKLQNVQLPK